MRIRRNWTQKKVQMAFGAYSRLMSTAKEG